MGIFIKIKKLFGTGSFEADDVQIDVTDEKEQKRQEKEQKRQEKERKKWEQEMRDKYKDGVF
jgi:uncharacterized protein (DUF3084 family)